MGKGLEQTFLQRQMGQPDHEKMLDITNHQGNANRNPIEILLHSHQDGQDTDGCSKRWWDVGNWSPRALLGGRETEQ